MRYNDSEEYFTDDESYTYDSSSSDLDVVRDLYWMGIDIIEPANNIYSKELVIRMLWVVILSDSILWRTPHALHILNLIR